MSTAPDLSAVFVSEEEYLAAEAINEHRSEYVAGVVYAMAGGSRHHNRICSNLIISLGQQLDGRPCEVFGSDMRLRIPLGKTTSYYYPDVSVDCSAQDVGDTEEPTVLFEVLSPSTARLDTGDKLLSYPSLSSLKVYVLVDQFQARVTVYRKGYSVWEPETLTSLDDTLELPEIECRLPLRVIYRRVLPAV